MSHQEKRAWRKRFSGLPLPRLKAIASELLTAAQSSSYNIEANIAASHYDPTLVCKTLATKEIRPGMSEEKQTVYCAVKRCSSCPHGPICIFIARPRARAKFMFVLWVPQRFQRTLWIG